MSLTDVDLSRPFPGNPRFIGGTRAAAILGLSEWETPLDAYLAMTDQREPETKRDRQRELTFLRGRIAEPGIIRMLEAKYGVEVTRRASDEDHNYHVDPELPYVAAQIDFEFHVTEELTREFPQIPSALIGTVQNGDAKSMEWMVALKRIGEAGTDEIPIEYYCQAMHGLMVTGRQLCLVAVAVGYDPIPYFVFRDDEMIAGMRAREISFYQNHVLPRVPPKPAVLADVYKLLKRKAPTRVEAPEEIAAAIRTLRTLKDRERLVASGIEAVQFEIGCWLLGQDAMEKPSAADKWKYVITFGGQPALTASKQDQMRVDTDMLRAKYPDAAAECARPTSFIRFDFPRKRS